MLILFSLAVITCLSMSCCELECTPEQILQRFLEVPETCPIEQALSLANSLIAPPIPPESTHFAPESLERRHRKRRHSPSPELSAEKFLRLTDPHNLAPLTDGYPDFMFPFSGSTGEFPYSPTLFCDLASQSHEFCIAPEDSPLPPQNFSTPLDPQSAIPCSTVQNVALPRLNSPPTQSTPPCAFQHHTRVTTALVPAASAFFQSCLHVISAVQKDVLQLFPKLEELYTQNCSDALQPNASLHAILDQLHQHATLHKWSKKMHTAVMILSEFCIFLISKPSLDLNFFEQIQGQYPNPHKKYSPKAPKKLQKLYAIQKQAKLTYIWQTLNKNLAITTNTVSDFIQQFTLLPDNLEQTLVEGAKLLTGLRKHPDLTYPLTKSITADTLCINKKTQLRDSLHLLSLIEERSASPASTEYELLSKQPPLEDLMLSSVNRMLQHPEERQEIITHIYSICHGKPAQDPYLLTMLAGIHSTLSSMKSPRNEIASLQVMIYLSIFALSNPTFSINLYSEVSEKFTEESSRAQRKVCKLRREITMTRKHVLLTYVLQILMLNSAPAVSTLQELIESLDLHETNPDIALEQTRKLLNGGTKHSKLKTPLVLNKAALLCHLKATCQILFTELQNFELNIPGHADADQTVPLSFFIEKFTEIQNCSDNAYTAVQDIHQQRFQCYADSSSLSEILLTVAQTFTPSKSYEHPLLGLQSIVEICAFVTSPPYVDFRLLKKIQEQYPNPYIGQSVRHKQFKIHHFLRIQLKLTYALQVLMANLPSSTQTLQSVLATLAIDTEDAEEALSRSYSLIHSHTYHPSLPVRCLISPAAFLCRKGLKCVDAIKWLRCIERIAEQSQTNQGYSVDYQCMIDSEL